jgi:hypothetical protein
MSKFWILLLSLSCVCGLQGQSISVASPASNAVVSGTITLSVSLSGLPSAQKVQYLVNGRVPLDPWDPMPAIVSPYSRSWSTLNLMDGRANIQAQALDSGGTVLATSALVNFRIANGSTTLTMSAPLWGDTVSGSMTLTLATNLPANQSNIFQCELDGQQIIGNFVHSASPTYSIDTTQWKNGLHDLFCSVGVEGSGQLVGYAQAVARVTFSNGAAHSQLLSSYRDVWLQVGDTLTLSPKLLNCDNTTSAVVSSPAYVSANGTIATVGASSGVITAVAQGMTTVTITSGTYTTTVNVIVLNNKSAFPHFGSSGQLLTSYTPGTSTFLRTMFFMDATQAAAASTQLKAAKLNTFTSGFYTNPFDSGNPSENYATWLVGEDNLLNSIITAANTYDFRIFLTGDDMARSHGELYATMGNYNSDNVAMVQHAIGTAKGWNKVIGIDMIDEADALWGSTPTPSDGRWLGLDFPEPDNALTTLMGIVRGTPGGTPPLTFPPSGPAPDSTVFNWAHPALFADYSTFYFTYAYSFIWPAYSWGHSVNQSLDQLNQSWQHKLAQFQLEKPKISISGNSGPEFFKQDPGAAGSCDYRPGIDVLKNVATQQEDITAEIMWTLAKGFAGIRTYGYEQNSGASRCAAGPNTQWQTFSSPTVHAPAWNSVSAAMNVVSSLEPIVFMPMTHAIDLGPTVYTGAKSGAQGKLLIAINSLEMPQTITADLTPYLYAAGTSIKRYRVVAGTSSTSQLTPQSSNDTITLAGGEAVAWQFTTPGRTVNHRLGGSRTVQ